MRKKYQGRSEDDYVEHSTGGPWLWSIIIVLLVALTFVCWVGSYYIFGQPERPMSYSILRKLDKIPVPKRFELEDAPKGDFVSAPKLYQKLTKMKPDEFEEFNTAMVRAYLRNYTQNKVKVPYLTGQFNILDVYELQAGDLFPSGVVALAQASDEPKLLIEYVYSADKENTPRILHTLKPGLGLKLHRTEELSAVTHVKRLDDGRVQLTVVNLNYGSYTPSEGAGGFTLIPPPTLNPEGGWPVIKSPIVDASQQRYAAQNPNGPAASAVPGTSIVSSRPDPRGVAPENLAARPASTPEPEIPKAIPVGTPVNPAIVAATPKLSASPAVTPTPVRVAVASTPIPVAVAVAATPQPATSPILQPFLTASTTATPVAPGKTTTWQTYAPGQMPRGRLVDPPNVGTLAESSVAGERVYLSGEFVVTAAEGPRAIMRVRNNIGSQVLTLGMSGANKVRLIVDYPAGYTPPRMGTVVERDAARAFQIVSVQRGSDGLVNVYAREVIAR